jgi:prophage regulatory protein
MHQLPETGYLRLRQIIGDANADPPIPAIIPVSKSTWWQGIRSGRFPQPKKLGPRITAWRVEQIRDLIENGASSCSGASAPISGGSKPSPAIQSTRPPTSSRSAATPFARGVDRGAQTLTTKASRVGRVPLLLNEPDSSTSESPKPTVGRTMMSSAPTIAKAIRGHKSGSGWTAHDDRNPSLSIRDGDDGKVAAPGDGAS